MISLIASSRVRKPYVYSSEALAIFDRANTEGFTLPSEYIQKVIDGLIKKMKLGGFWAKQDLILNFAYNNTLLSDFSRINWKNPTGNLATKYGTATYKIDGWEGNLTDGYLGTGYNPATNGINFTQNNAGVGMVLRAYGAPTRFPYGQVSGTTIYHGNTAGRLNTGGLITYPAISAIQSYSFMNRTGSALSNAIINSNQYTDNVSTSVAVISSEITLFKRVTDLSNARMSFFNMGGSITFIESQQFILDYNNFLVNLGLTTI